MVCRQQSWMQLVQSVKTFVEDLALPYNGDWSDIVPPFSGRISVRNGVSV